MHLNDVFPPTNTLSIRYRYPSCVFCISIVIANDCEIVSTCTYKRFGGARLHACGVPPPRRFSGCMQVGRRRTHVDGWHSKCCVLETYSFPPSFLFISLHPIILFLSFSPSHSYFDNLIPTFE